MWYQRWNWRGSESGDEEYEEELDSEEDENDNDFVFNDLDEKSYPSQTIQFISDDHQICEVVVQGSWDVSINIEVTCLHIVTLAFCGGSDWRGGNMKSSTANVGDQNHTVCFKGNHISATLSQKSSSYPPPLGNK